MSTARMTGPDAVAAVNLAISKATRIDDVPCHPVAAAFPLIDGDDWDAFKADIAAHGLREPIVIDHQGRIIDGRNRARAIIELGTRAPTARCVVMDFVNDELITQYIISANLRRRQLTISQRVAIAAELANISNGGDRRSNQIANLQTEAVTTEKAAETMQVSKSSVDKYKAANVKDANPEAHAQVKAGKKTATAAISETKIKAAKKPAPKPKPAPAVELNPGTGAPKAKVLTTKLMVMPHAPVYLDELWAKLKPHLEGLEDQGKANMATISPGTVAYLTCLVLKALEGIAAEHREVLH